MRCFIIYANLVKFNVYLHIHAIWPLLLIVNGGEWDKALANAIKEN